MKRVEIDWWDSSRTPGWNEAFEGAPMLCTSIGFVVHRTKKWITICGNHNGGTQFCDQMTIPLAVVKRVRVL